MLKSFAQEEYALFQFAKLMPNALQPMACGLG
jgi:hypothetical protein